MLTKSFFHLMDIRFLHKVFNRPVKSISIMGKIPYKGNAKVRFSFFNLFLYFDPKILQSQRTQMHMTGQLGYTVTFVLQKDSYHTSHTRQPTHSSPKLSVDGTQVCSLHLLACVLHLRALITKVSNAHYIYRNKL